MLSFCKFNYWVDSGSLLLVTRDACIPKTEDFDIGAMHDENKIKKLENKLKEIKIPFQLSIYHGSVYKVKIKFENCMPIDIIFFSKTSMIPFYHHKDITRCFIENLYHQFYIYIEIFLISIQIIILN